MKEHDLLDAVGQVSDETVEKYALPDAKTLGTADTSEDFAGSITQTKKKPFRIYMGAAAAAVALCLGLNVAIFYGIHKMKSDTDSGITPGTQISSAEESGEYKTPNLIGMDYEEAMLMYGDVLQIVCESEEYSDYDVGKIFTQDVMPGEPLKKGDTVHVRVSIGPKKVLMPDVTDWEFETAKSTIVGLGLYIDKRNAYDPEVEKGKVISTDPEGPIEVEPGSYIRVTVSLGKNGGGMAVPNFSNMQWDNAKSIAEALKIIVSKKEVPDAAPAGTVLSQNVQPGEEVSENTEIELTVSSGEAVANAVRITFNIPADITGKYHIGLYADGAAAAIGGQFDPEAAAGVTMVVVEGEGTAEYQAKLFNDENGKEAVLGTYRVDFGNQFYEPLSEDIAKAFAEVQD
ncbi:MAG: PASTA domain-containing protein [Oscillospiraceae bacterium]|nr:PASTA domain-containing protein [Oscillospiraceae bacterium]